MYFINCRSWHLRFSEKKRAYCYSDCRFNTVQVYPTTEGIGSEQLKEGQHYDFFFLFLLFETSVASYFDGNQQTIRWLSAFRLC